MARALVTGATAGIGHAFARQLAGRGHNLVLVARDRDRLDAVAAELGPSTEVLPADLTDPAELARVEQRIADPTEPIDLLVNNAGSSLAHWFGSTDIDDEDRQLDLLVRAPMRLMDAALKARIGGIINVASVAAFTPRGTYSAHKAWLVNLSQWAHIRFAADTQVMALCPGFVRTEFHQRAGMNTTGIPSWMWLDADRVVTDALTDFNRGRSLSIPSNRYKALSMIARYAPVPLVARAARKGR